MVEAFIVSDTNLSLPRDSVTHVGVLCLPAIELRLAPFCDRLQTGAANILLQQRWKQMIIARRLNSPNMITISVGALVKKLYDTRTYFLTNLLLLGAHSAVLLCSQT